MSIIPNSQQRHAIEEGKKWWKLQNKQIFTIAGYAGTGKTTLVRWILEACNISIEEGAYVAFVGKAAMVLSMKGLPARTIHSTIYECIDVPKRDENGEIIKIHNKIVMTKKFVLKSSLPDTIKVIVVDEGSMVDDRLMKDLKSFGIPIIVLGDLHQLPPVFGRSSCMMHPDVVLSEIMRQDEGNPIIHFATMARECKWNEFRYGSYGGKVFIAPKEQIMASEKLLRNSNVILCAFNKTRSELNKYVREEIYHMPKNNIGIGEKLICRENCWDLQLDDIVYLTNGMIGYVTNINYEDSTKNGLVFDFRPEFVQDACFEEIILDWHYLNDLSYEERKDYIAEHIKFEHGYVITCHLAQGSQYDSVLIYNEYMRRSAEDYSKWLYTAITRAVNRLVIAI